ncbi:MAG: triose-phosphate isomerase [Alphaproteobacteria bacterium]
MAGRNGLMRQLIAGNWKMNGLRAALAEIRALDRALSEQPAHSAVLICPPATLIAEAARAITVGRLAIGAQDCHPEPAGAFTGDLSAEMLRDAGATHVIVGHSERRQYHGESSAEVAAKAAAANRAGLTAIVCVGETEEQRDAKKAVSVVTSQLGRSVPSGFPAQSLIVAYEPVWAIGTGRTPTNAQIAEMHAAARDALDKRFGVEAAKIRILYGGSVKPANAKELLSIANVDGALVGGASIKASDFLGIIRAAPTR